MLRQKIAKSQTGQNRIPPAETVKWYEILLEKFEDPILRILMVACAASFGVAIYSGTSALEPACILAAILITAGVAWWQDMKSNSQFKALEEMSASRTVMVRRMTDSEEHVVYEIDSDDVCVGDEVILKAGDEVCADMMVIECDGMECDESSLTGESLPVKKQDEHDYGDSAFKRDTVYRGTYVTSGEGVAMVEAVGGDTVFGRTVREARAITSQKTPLTKQLENLAGKITKMSYWMAALIVIALTASGILGGTITAATALTAEIGILMFALVIIIAAVPEGLSLSVVLSLTYSVKAMLKDNNLIRKMKASETLGAVDVIFTDKTGTITENKMAVTGIDTADEGALMRMAFNSIFNSEASVGADGFVGNPTDCAMMEYVKNSYVVTDGDIQAYIRENRKHRTHNVPFNSTDKYMSSTFSDGKTYVKGAPSVIAKMVGDESFLETVNAAQEVGSRVISFASTNDDGRLAYDGSMYISDPVRQGVKEAMEKCRNAGIHVVMLTGDDILTATAIAKEAGFDHVYASDAADLTKAATFKCNVISRCTPDDKLRILEAYQSLGCVCAMTGDGVNDSPALNHADVGVAMGAGSAVAKESADIVLLDNAFPSIVKGIKWGRAIYKNIQSFLAYQLSINVALCAISCLAPLFGKPEPFTVLQVLYINLIMDALGALALASEPASDTVLDEKPRDKGEFIINDAMKSFIGGFGGALAMLIMIAWLCGWPATGVFVMFTSACICNLFWARGFGKSINPLTTVFENKLFCAVVVGTALACAGVTALSEPTETRFYLAAPFLGMAISFAGEALRQGLRGILLYGKLKSLRAANKSV